MKKDPLAPDELFLGDCLQLFYAFTEPLIASQLRTGGRVLDVGCGDGKLVLKMLKVVPLGSVVGIDIREKAVEIAGSISNSGNTQFLEGDAQDMNWVQHLGIFDAILARTSLHHFRDPIDSLLQYKSLLPSGGKLILIDIDRESACFSLFGFPLTLLITWVAVLKTLGWRRGWKAILGMKYPSKEWRQHRAVDVAHRKKIGWYRFSDIQPKLQLAFPTARIGRLASCCGFGGVHYMVYTKESP
ncbi:MAG: class I SAM-dependent methyltransferase [Candidatus Sumerlaeota bacterium]|nr:class I SAM-dependent methyltransferase [Candidatus Sumerlaeota bacterium]